MSFRVDLHTHSYGSPDGALQASDYRRMLESGRLDYIAITDHNRTDIAERIRSELAELGDRIIVGEEITCREGEIIGLYLSELVPSGLSVKQAAERVKAQGGLVYVPHPFETVRSGVPLEALNVIADTVDIVEIHNGRAVFQDRSGAANAWAHEHRTPGAASSDAHGWYGWGKTYSLVASAPTCDTLCALLAAASYSADKVGLGILYPKLNRLRKRTKSIQ